MNFEFANQINPCLERFDFSAALQIAEGELKKLPGTPFHEVLGKSMTSQAETFASWVKEFFEQASKKEQIKSLYCEMNEFDINTDHWYVDCFAFSIDEGLTRGDMDWLCDYEADTESRFVIEGFDKLQAAFGSVDLNTESLQDAIDWCEQIILTRFMELVRTAHVLAMDKNYGWAGVPVYFSEHDYDFILKSEL